MNLAQPGWLVLLLLIPLLGIGALLVARLRRAQWQGFVAPRLRPNLLRRASTLPRWIALLFCLAATASLVAALSRPQGDAGTKTEKSLGRNVLIALDLSRSMRVTDVKPDRLSQAKVVLYELLDAMPGDRVGLIGFAAWASRRYLPQLLARISAERGERRMAVVETLVLDPARRLVLVRIDNEERLLILGEGRELIEPRGPEADQ
jgi:flagellar protein FliO/FliZ